MSAETPRARGPREVSVVVPCYNEARNLPELVARLLATFERAQVDGEIVLVNDGSRDETGAVIDGLAATHPEVVGCHHVVNQGMEAGWNTGVRATSGVYVCFIDADLQYEPEDVARLYAAMRESGADIVQGCRVTPTSVRDSRYAFSRGLNFLLNAAFGMRLRDNKSGFILAKREVVLHVLQHARRYRYFQALLLVSAHAKGYSVHEIETAFGPRRRGQSFMSNVPLKVIAGCLADVLNGLLEFRLASRRSEPGARP
jgi:glycosyltransferase involved in cell wall biosynthesis